MSSTITNAAARVAIGAVVAFFASSTHAVAQVNWLDPLKYTKPRAVSINKPSEASVANKYWVDMTNGSGTTCSQSSPCKSMDNVLGKPGTQGGPAIIYVKGTGTLSWYNDSIYGSGNVDCRSSSCANWILIRTWPAGSPGCATECTATFNGSSHMNSPNIHHIMWDGGPDLKIRFESNVAGSFSYANDIDSDWHVIYRTQLYCTGSNNQVRGWQVGASTVAEHVYFINNEFHSCASTGDQVSAVYVGAGSPGGYADFVFQNNIVRDMGGDGLEVNPRVASSGATITGNAFHNVGKGTCSGNWKCRPAITMSTMEGSRNDATVIANNLMWDIGASCVYDRGGGTPKPLIVNNTCYDYGKGSGVVNPEGISGYTDGGTAIVRNNIFYAPTGKDPLDGSAFTASNNICASGKSCGSSSRTWSTATVLSTDPNAAGFLMLGASSEAKDGGIAVSGVSSVSYGGTIRPQDAAYDIGAFEGGAGTTPPPPPPASPTNVRIVR